MQSFDYFFRSAFRGIRENLFVTILSVVTITVSLLTLSVFLLLYLNLRASAARWGGHVQVVAYLKGSVSAEEVNHFSEMISRLPGVSAVKYVSMQDALVRFRHDLGGQSGILDGLTYNPLPASFEIQLREGGSNPEQVREVAERVAELSSVEDVQYGEEWLAQYATFLKVLQVAAGVIGAFLLLGSVLIVSNTIRLAVYARREELEILSLVGASSGFVRTPFLIEGVAQGFLGAVLAVSILYAGYHHLLSRIEGSLLLSAGGFEPVFLPVPALLALLGIGAAVGLFGSALSVRRFGEP
jgi:cell division transport system permease protein